MARLNKILTDNFDNMTGPNTLKELIAILITRNTKKL